MLDKLDAALRFGTEALNLRAQRQEILASNIANADTPGYQARDIDFASQLSKVMQNGRATLKRKPIHSRRWICCTAFPISLPRMETPWIWIANVRSLQITA